MISPGARGLLAMTVGLVLVCLLFPVLVVVVLSFSDGSFLTFPPPGYSLQWFKELLSLPEWRHAYLLTFMVASSTAILSVLIGVPASFALARYRIRWRPVFDTVLLTTL